MRRNRGGNDRAVPASGGADSNAAASGAAPSSAAAPLTADATFPHSTCLDSANVDAYASTNGTRTGDTTASTSDEDVDDAVTARRIGPGKASRHHTVSSESTGTAPDSTSDKRAGDATLDAQPRKSTDAAARTGPSPSAERVRATRARNLAGSAKVDSAVHPTARTASRARSTDSPHPSHRVRTGGHERPGCRIDASASTPSTSRGPGRTTSPSPSIAHTAGPGSAAATTAACATAPSRWNPHGDTTTTSGRADVTNRPVDLA